MNNHFGVVLAAITVSVIGGAFVLDWMSSSPDKPATEANATAVKSETATADTTTNGSSATVLADAGKETSIPSAPPKKLASLEPTKRSPTPAVTKPASIASAPAPTGAAPAPAATIPPPIESTPAPAVTNPPPIATAPASIETAPTPSTASPSIASSAPQ